jgi:putative transposase
MAVEAKSLSGRCSQLVQFPAVAAMRTEAKTDLSAFVDFSQAHWRKLWSTNPLSAN